MRILIAEDDTALASFVRKGLEAEHYAVDVSGDGEQARALASELDFDLVVLDLNLPRLDGVSILRSLRTKKADMPILVLTARSRVEDRVQCLDTGADDYLVKPFSFSELSARIRALLRRSHTPSQAVLTVDDLKLDRVERRVERAGKRIELTSKEFGLLEYLMRNAGRRITRAMIIEHVWNLSFDTATNVVDVYINYLEQPLDSLDVQKVADLIAQDKSLAAQCLHLANSPLFGRWQEVDSVRSAVVALGLRRMREIAMSCCLLRLWPGEKYNIDPVVFWEHSMGCALVCRRFAHEIGFANAEKAYLAGLLHDVGIVVNLWTLPKEFCEAYEVARSQRIPLHEAEMQTLGFTHCESGRMLAERWHLSPELSEVISRHHDVQNVTEHGGLIAVVAISDLLCRMSGVGHGHTEERQVNFLEEPSFALLIRECPPLGSFDWARFTFEMEAYVEEVKHLVGLIYRPQ
jgi:DNA-binding response OmpR family regulator